MRKRFLRIWFYICIALVNPLTLEMSTAGPFTAGSLFSSSDDTQNNRSQTLVRRGPDSVPTPTFTTRSRVIGITEVLIGTVVTVVGVTTIVVVQTGIVTVKAITAGVTVASAVGVGLWTLLMEKVEVNRTA